MGAHKTNPNVAALKRGELTPRVKAEKPPSKRESAFLALWAKAVGNRPAPPPQSNRNDRAMRRQKRREQAAHLRKINALAMQAIRARKKAARKSRAA